MNDDEFEVVDDPEDEPVPPAVSPVSDFALFASCYDARQLVSSSDNSNLCVESNIRLQ